MCQAFDWDKEWQWELLLNYEGLRGARGICGPKTRREKCVWVCVYMCVHVHVSVSTVCMSMCMHVCMCLRACGHACKLTPFNAHYLLFEKDTREMRKCLKIPTHDSQSSELWVTGLSSQVGISCEDTGMTTSLTQEEDCLLPSPRLLPDFSYPILKTSIFLAGEWSISINWSHLY